MSKKILADVTNTIPHMVRSRIDGGDLEILIPLPDGVLTIDLVSGIAQHANGDVVKLALVAHLVDWLKERLAKAGLDSVDLTKAELVISIRTDRVPTDRKKLVPFEFSSTANLAIDTTVCSSKPAFALLWYDRIGGRITD